MLGSKLTVSVDGTRLSAPLTPATIIAFERHYKVNYLQALADLSSGDSRVEYMYWLAWEALRRAKLFGDTFDVFLDAADGVVHVDAIPEADVGPLPQGA